MKKESRPKMRFRIEHRTTYRYAGTASESFMEARLTPVTDAYQQLVERKFSIQPACNIHSYQDYYGNMVDTFSIVHRHEKLTLTSESVVETQAFEPPNASVAISVSEARQLYRGKRLMLYEFMMPSPAINLSSDIHQLANRFFKPGYHLGPSLLELNHWIKTHFKYVTGSTKVDTTVQQVLKQGTGVCQDFAQLMIAVLRSAEIPARYVAGYIETENQRQVSAGQATLVGASESHAWVEVYLPGGFWWALDPTNDCAVGERHVKVAVGRDYLDSTPTRGVFKGTHTEWLGASVVMKREVA